MKRKRRRRGASFEEGDGFLMFGLRNSELGWKEKCLKKAWKIGRRRWVSHFWIGRVGIVLDFGRRGEMLTGGWKLRKKKQMGFSIEEFGAGLEYSEEDLF